jgi:CRP-like cAMP-binding protein
MIRVNTDLLSFFNEFTRSAEGASFVSGHKFAPKKTILEQGVRVEFVHIIKSGIAKCSILEENGAEFIQEFFGEGEIFGEIEMFNDDDSFGSVESLTELEIYRISRKTFDRLLDENRRFNRLILSALAAKIKYKAFRHSFHQLNPIETNLLHLKKQFPDLLKTISKQDIASYLGITERSFNRALKSLKDKNLFD